MERKIIFTADGSHSVSIPEMNVTYHSIHGAVQESMHVFIEAGFYKVSDALQASETIRILEIGLGTGLNALLSLIEAEKSNQKIYYEALEPFPLNMEEARSLNYCEILQRNDLQPSFEQLHNCEWEKEIKISETFCLRKTQQSLQNYKTCLAARQASEFKDLIFFDAFAPNAQPELWMEEIFEKMFSILRPNGILVTYCSKGSVRRAMRAAGFVVEKIPGPPGKREMIRARKAK